MIKDETVGAYFMVSSRRLSRRRGRPGNMSGQTVRKLLSYFPLHWWRCSVP